MQERITCTAVIWLIAAIAAAAAAAAPAADGAKLLLRCQRLSNISHNFAIALLLYCQPLPLSAAAIVAELELAEQLRHMALLNEWPGCGLMYTFIGFVSLEVSDLDSNAPSVFCDIIGWSVVAVGIAYFLLGIARLRAVSTHAHTPAACFHA